MDHPKAVIITKSMGSYIVATSPVTNHKLLEIKSIILHSPVNLLRYFIGVLL